MKLKETLTLESSCGPHSTGSTQILWFTLLWVNLLFYLVVVVGFWVDDGIQLEYCLFCMITGKWYETAILWMPKPMAPSVGCFPFNCFPSHLCYWCQCGSLWLGFVTLWMREREREIERIDLGVSKRERDRWMEERSEVKDRKMCCWAMKMRCAFQQWLVANFTPDTYNHAHVRGVLQALTYSHSPLFYIRNSQVSNLFIFFSYVFFIKWQWKWNSW